ncbi:putative membrane protein [Candidatus Kuenenia stuttgartiensis]|jgi:uncharacterized membrane protein YidH (DUF202 family)|uniref:Putative membrane protein n=1 Tax=Kuenenia stuttgartiensis TaxID=174633 RepID=Q1Q2M6_KUEST|nr:MULTISPECIES: general glycosylation pathway protein [Kuenenia]MBE7548870.1 general glycosylation pathway protein [Planctomycetia bacterium]MBZ0190798.1 hypothetical protein [Candidatus Kuenenia stuttgartiensis]MCL4726079.1 hypothetical protein [Candidatus Kuenenia stuttgartiensis]MCZ7622378.1 hypothetical protein [Candidatus Kuenenia sp.]QII11374.1 putative membrane protein [Candidatus Kuenenia stuttgartiensis]
MSGIKDISDRMGRVVYGLISLSLGLISFAMMVVALWGIWVSVHEKTLLEKALLDAIGLIVIGMAVFDVSKFLAEEEVFNSGGAKSPTKQRESLLKFLAIIAIAVSLEALVFIFDAGKKEISSLIYPTFLLIAAVSVVVGLGVYQKLTRNDGDSSQNNL